MQNVKKGDFVKLEGTTYRVASRRGDGVLELADYRGKIVDVLPESDTRLLPGKKEDMVANSRACNGVRSTNAVVQNALNARTARNADGDGAAVKAIRDLQRRIAPLAREAEAMRGKFIANKWYGYDAALEFIAKRLKEAEAEGKW